jgi:hypothetical protein
MDYKTLSPAVLIALGLHLEACGLFGPCLSPVQPCLSFEPVYPDTDVGPCLTEPVDPPVTVCLEAVPPDWDRDSDGHINEVDCNDLNAAVHPGAKEDCTNKIDDDCNGKIDDCDDPEKKKIPELDEQGALRERLLDEGVLPVDVASKLRGMG